MASVQIIFRSFLKESIMDMITFKILQEYAFKPNVYTVTNIRKNKHVIKFKVSYRNRNINFSNTLEIKR